MGVFQCCISGQVRFRQAFQSSSLTLDHQSFAQKPRMEDFDDQNGIKRALNLRTGPQTAGDDQTAETGNSI